MKEKEIIVLCEEYAKACHKDKEPGHDYLHVQRVRKMALKLAKTVQCDHFLVEILALLHDIEDHKFKDNNRVKDFLDAIDIEDYLKEKILFILPYLSFSKCRCLPASFPIEGKIIQDADRLDAIGAIGVARAFSYGGSHQRKMYGDDESTIKHFEDKLLLIDRYLYLDESKKIAKKRSEFIKDFYQEFLNEIDE